MGQINLQIVVTPFKFQSSNLNHLNHYQIQVGLF